MRGREEAGSGYCDPGTQSSCCAATQTVCSHEPLKSAAAGPAAEVAVAATPNLFHPRTRAVPASAPIAPHLARALTVPAMPEVAQMLRAFDPDDLSLLGLSGLIGCDATLAAKVLRVARSARNLPAHTIGTVKDTAAALGLSNLRGLTLSACLS